MRREKRKINKFKVGIIVFVFILFLLTTSGLGRFVYNTIRDRYLTSKKFYFESDLLKSNGQKYNYKNWDGTGLYNFEFELYSKINDLQKLEEEQEYTIMVTFDQPINCAINSTYFVEPELYQKEEDGSYKTDGSGNLIKIPVDQLNVEKPISTTSTILPSNDNKDVVTIYVKAISEEKIFSQGNKVQVHVTAYTSSPYKKSLSATFEIEISTSYTIEDSEYSKYAILTVRNTSNLDQYFTINLNSSVTIDMNDDSWVHRNTYTYYTKDPNTNKIASVTFEVPKDTSQQIRLYKYDISRKYTISNSPVTISKKISY